jgi:hypothetical protein
MTSFDIDYPSFSLPDSELPVTLNRYETDSEIYSLFEIDDARSHVGRPLLRLLNAGFRIDGTSGRFENSTIQIRHRFARDEEGDGCYVASFELDSLLLMNAFDDTITFRGWLTQMKFYDPRTVSPFVGIEQKDDSGENYDANYGYPYIPPKAHFDTIKLPIPVHVHVTHGRSGDLLQWLDNING